MITCRYSCLECGITDRMVKVPAREDGDDVRRWMREVCISALCFDHEIMAPLCNPKALSYIKIPFDPNDPKGWIGKQIDLVPPEGIPTGYPTPPDPKKPLE